MESEEYTPAHGSVARRTEPPESATDPSDRASLPLAESVPPAPEPPPKAPSTDGAALLEEPAAPPRRARFVAWFNDVGVDVVLLAALTLLTLLVRLLTLEGVGSGGDAFGKWQFVRQWFYHNDFHGSKWTHHMARLGVTSIAYLAQVSFGRSVNVYYVPPVTAAVVETWFVYACAKRISGRAAGFVGAMILIYFKGQVRAASQLMPEIFSATYALIATYFYLRYTAAEGRRKQAWLLAMGAAAFVAYLAKETSVFFYPGFALAIWMERRSMRDLAVFSSMPLLGLGCETALYKIFTHYPHRLAIIRGSHNPEGPLSETEFWGLFDRYVKLDQPWRVGFYLALPSVLGVLAFRRDRRADAIVAITVSYYLALTFLVKSLHPIVIWQAFLPRYLDPTAPFVALVLTIFLALVFAALLSRRKSSRWARVLALVSPPGWAVGLVLAGLAGFWSYADAKPDLDDNALVLNAKIAGVVNDAYRRNLPLVATGDARGLHTVYSVFLDDRLLARQGELPDYESARLIQHGKTFLVRYPSVYGDEDVFRSLVKKGCRIEIHAKAGLPIKVNPLQKLDADCDAR